MTRICTKCNMDKLRTIENYPANKRMKDGLSSWCRDCHRTSSRNILRRTPDRNVARARAWDAAHPEEARERVQAWKSAHPERLRELGRRHSNLRRGRVVNAAGFYTEEQLEARMEFFGGQCWLHLEGCSGLGDTIDHVIPLARGGTNWPANLRPACGHCNSVKGTKLPSELEMV